MRKLYVNIVLLNFLFLVISYFLLPERVASHFGRGGIPNAYTTKVNYLMLFIALDLPMALFYYYLPLLVINMPKKLVGLPNQDHWLKAENKQATRKLIEPLIYECGSALFVFLLFCAVFSLKANSSTPVILNEGAMFFGLVFFVIYITYWCIKFYKIFSVRK